MPTVKPMSATLIFCYCDAFSVLLGLHMLQYFCYCILLLQYVLVDFAIAILFSGQILWNE